MNRDLLQIVHTVTPAETHFVVSADRYAGILSFWVVALVKNHDDQEPFLDSFPIIADGTSTIYEQIQDDSLTVVHWSEMREWMQVAGIARHDKRFLPARDLLERLWGE